MLNLKPITIKDKELFDYYISMIDDNQITSEINFTNLFAWSSYYNYHYLVYHDLLWIMTISENKISYLLPPIGKLSYLSNDVINNFINLIKTHTKNEIIFKRMNQGHFDYFKDYLIQIDHTTNDDDYVYLSTDMADLIGNRFRKKRQQIKKCYSMYNITISKITDENVKHCLPTLLEANMRHDDEFMNENDLTFKFGRHSVTYNIGTLKKFYDDLYIKKYSQYNNQFTYSFYQDRLNSDYFKHLFVIKEGKVVGFAICFTINNIMSTPLLGYASDKHDYYRVTSYCLQQYAISNHFIDHASAGVGKFKRSRGYKAYTEYRAYQPTSCVNMFNRFVWNILAFIINSIFVPIAKKNNFL